MTGSGRVIAGLTEWRRTGWALGLRTGRAGLLAGRGSRSKTRLFASILLAMASFTAATSSWAIKDGTPNYSKNVVVLTYDALGSSGGPSGWGYCSGVLITPGHVLTAAHCLNGSIDKLHTTPTSNGIAPGASIRIENGFGPPPWYHPVAVTGGPQPDTANDITFYMPGTGLNLWTMTAESPIDFNADHSSERDLAVIPVNRRVRLAAATPATLPFYLAADGSFQLAGTAPTTFFGAFMGYASGDDTFVGAKRREAALSITRQQPSIWGDVYRHDFPVTLSAIELSPEKVLLDALELALDAIEGKVFYGQLQHGDSGGPLFDESAVLRGINSANMLQTPLDPEPLYVDVCVPPVCPPYPIPCYCYTQQLCVPDTPLCVYNLKFTHSNRWARVDRDPALNFLETVRPPIFDNYGHLFATCGANVPAPFNDIDSDGDMIPDGCDPCPRVADPTYSTSGLMWHLEQSLDTDKDGVPDLCDNCPNGFNSDNPAEAINGEWVQADSDGDGLGDACDKCAHSEVRPTGDLVCCNKDSDCGNPKGDWSKSKCLPIADVVVDVGPPVNTVNACPGTEKRCSQGLDADEDGWQDTCDNCTTDYNPTQADYDDDGVGDECDNCSGKHSVDKYANTGETPAPDPLDDNLNVDIPSA